MQPSNDALPGCDGRVTPTAAASKRTLPTPSRTGMIPAARIDQLIAAGYGQGHRSQYQPWLRVERGVHSPRSPMGHLNAPEFGHLHHYRNRAQLGALLMIRWLGAYDARDQYPIWPWRHRHPAYGLPGHEDAPLVAGADDIANVTKLGRAASCVDDAWRALPILDILSTWISPDGCYYLVAHDCSADEGPEKAPWSKSVELLLKRHYAQQIGAAFHTVPNLVQQRQLVVNLGALYPQLDRPQLRRVRLSRDYRFLTAVCRRWGYDMPLHEAVKIAARRLDSTCASLHRLAPLALWLQDVDHDLSHPLEPWLPLRRGGRALRSTLRSSWAAQLTTARDAS